MRRLALDFAMALAALVPLSSSALAQTAPAAPEPPSVNQILNTHDAALVADLQGYLDEHPAASDAEQAYLILFERAIEYDWYTRLAPRAQRYLTTQSEGPVAPLARIIVTMACADAGQFDQALASYRSLMAGLNQPEQEQFAADFASSLAAAAAAGGAGDVAKEVYETLARQFADSPQLQQKTQQELARLSLLQQPAPRFTARDLNNQSLRLADLSSQYVLVDFWATWCAPCVDDLPGLRALYDQYHARGFEVVSISLDENPQAVADFIRARQIPWPQLHQASCGADLVGAFHVTSLPASYLVGPDGTILRLNPRGDALGAFLAQVYPD